MRAVVGSYRVRRALVMAVAIALSACVGTPTTPTKTKGAPAPKATPKASEAPGGGESPAASPVGSTGPTQAPSVSPSASPSVAPSSSPSPALSAAEVQRRTALAEKLLKIAQAGFLQNRNSLLGNNSASVIGNNGGNIISNNGVGVISNNAGNVISNNGGGYRVLQASPTIDASPRAGEMLYIHSLWPDDTVTKSYTLDFAKRYTDYRNVELLADQTPVASRESKVVSTWPSGAAKQVETIETILHRSGPAKGQLLFYMHYLTDLAEDGATLKAHHVPNTSKFRDPVAKAAIDYAKLVVDPVAGTTEFEYRYVDLGMVEKGTLSGVRLNAQGKFELIAQDPLGLYDGESRVETPDGTLLFLKKQTTANQKTTRTYDLGGNLVMALERKSGIRFEGPLSQDGTAIAQVVMELQTNGTTLFTVSFTDAPELPMQVGYGDTVTAPASPSPAPNPPTHWVDTPAGAGTVGYVDGPGASARFGQLYSIARSRVNLSKYYLADASNHRIRVMTVGTDKRVTLSTYAGSGTAGSANGPADQAQFNTPFGIAVAADDTLYITDGGGHQIRKVTPDGVVSTYSGAGTPGAVNGSATGAKYRSPAGLVLADDGTLYVADMGNHAIRKVATDGSATVLAGNGNAGFVDAVGSAARFKNPVGITMGADGKLYVADRENFRIRRVSMDGTVETYAGSGVLEKSFLDGPALEGGLANPLGLCFGPDGKLYLANNLEIRQVTADGAQLRTYVAGWESGTFKDGPNKEALFKGLFGIAPGPDGTFFVTDGTRIRRVMPPGYLSP